MQIKVWLPLVIVLGWALQVVYDLTNRQFFFFVMIAGALVFIINGLTHSDEIDADEAAEKGVKKAKKAVKSVKQYISGTDNQEGLDSQSVSNAESPKPWTILVDAVYCLVDEEGQINQPLLELLEGYPQRKIIVTNANDKQMKQYHLDELPYDLFTMKHRPSKQDPIYFATLAEQFALDRDRTVYFDHDLGAVLSAKSMRIKGFHYEGDLTALKTFLDSTLEESQ